MKPPRPLLIVVIILIVLGFGGCVTSIVGGEESDDEQKEDELRSGDLGDLFGRLAPATEPVQLAPADADCMTANGNLQFSGTCDLTIRPTDDLRRSLTLELTGSSTMVMEVELTVGGDDLPSKSQQVPLDDGSRVVSVVVSSGDSAEIMLTCGFPATCSVLVNPE